MSYSALLSPINVGAMRLPNRVFMAPLTRLRSDDLPNGTKNIGGLPTPLMATYYTQRASSGLIITEATDISADAKGYAGAPGVFSDAQIAGWKMIAVTATPAREMTTAEIKQTVDDFASAARNAIEAGMDVIEIHGAHGYLIHQFLYESVNQRSDEYGGSLENRMRFLKEILTAVTSAIGSDKVGIRISPLGQFNGVDAGSEDDALAIIKLIDSFYIFLSQTGQVENPLPQNSVAKFVMLITACLSVQVAIRQKKQTR